MQFFMDNIVYPGYTWVGGETKTWGSGIWSWIDGTPWSYTNWGPGEPVNMTGMGNEADGLELGNDYYWSSYNKDYSQSYTCQY